MTHQDFVTNGASLEDCHTNFFALADLCGIKWRRLCAESILCVDPLEDPVLQSYSKCLAADILCVWRRVMRGNGEHHRAAGHETNQLNYNKELWIFWYGEEPDLSGLICPELSADAEHGSWESGLSYECRSLLFKALHNLIERCLLSRGFTRFGKWFVQPGDANDKLGKSPQLTFSFSFFVHGESTVCCSVDVRQHPSVYRLSKQHLLAAQSSHLGLKVILSPYGMAGTLSGQSYKESDPSTQRLITEWRQFYPLPTRDHSSRDNDDDALPCAVEVLVGGVKMRYPISYVFVCDTDESVSTPASSSSSRLIYSATSTMASSGGTTQSAMKSAAPVLSVLTPPTSPCDPASYSSTGMMGKMGGAAVTGDGLHHHHAHHHASLHHAHQYNPAKKSQHLPSTAFRIKSSVWQDSTIPHPSSGSGTVTAADQTSPEEAVGQWDFCDPCTRVPCNCYKCKKSSSSFSSAGKSLHPAATNSSGSLSGASNLSSVPSAVSSSVNSASVSAARKGDKSEKEKGQRTRNMVPFHRRNPESANIWLDLDYELASPAVATSTATLPPSLGAVPPAGPTQYKITPGAAAGRSMGLPQLHSSSLDSPRSSAPVLIDAPSSQLSSSDPTMPTLSPHPPASKEEDTALQAESHEPSVVMQSPVSTPEVTNRDKSQTEQMSPFTTNLASVLDGTKVAEGSPSVSAGQWSTGGQVDEAGTPSAQVLTPGATQQSNNSVATAAQSSSSSSSSSALSQGLKRPQLPVRSHDDLEDEDLAPSILYSEDFGVMGGPTWELPAPKRRRITAIAGNRRGPSELCGPPCPAGQDGSKQLDEGDAVLPKAKDPYEFSDECDEDSPSSTTFRNRVDSCPKDEEKSKETPSVPQTPEPATPQPATKDSQKLNPLSDPVTCVSSPQTPRNQGSSFTREVDLQVTYKDLDQIFDTSSGDDSNDDTFQPPSTPSSVKHVGMGEEGASGKTSKASTAGIIGAVELARMFPTPPSLENNTASPSCPLGGPDMSLFEGMDNAVMGNKLDIYSNCGSPGQESVKDWSYVYVPPVQHRFVGSSRYAPLSSLPPASSSECVYKPSWPQYTAPVPGMAVPPHGLSPGSSATQAIPGPPGGDRHPSTNHHLSNLPPVETDRLFAPFPGEASMDQRGMYELQSPASNASSYLNKHLNSVDNTSTVSSVPEAHSLLVNLVLSDSMLNMFRDHNFASCTVCVCNMNIKGADAGICLPDSLLPPPVTDEPQENCKCGFSAVVNRHHSHRSGLFYDDEVEITGIPYECDASANKKSILTADKDPAKAVVESGGDVDHIPPAVMKIVKNQCTTMYSSCSLFYKAVPLNYTNSVQAHHNALANADGCEICFLALDTARQVMDNINTSKIDESLKSSCMHKWPYFPAKLPSSNHEIVRLLRQLQPLLQDAVQKKRTKGMWEVTYTVSGPLTWRQFHRLAGRGTEDQCEPQPIPSLLVGYDKDWLALSPFALKYWEKLLLEPYSMTRDVAYVVVAPDNEFILNHVRAFFKELSSIYELCRLGRHCPITKVLRDGILRVGKTAAKNLAGEAVDEWFNLIGDGPVASKLKLYAQVCRHHLAPHLATQPLDRSLLDGAPSCAAKPTEKNVAPAASPMPPSTPESQDKDGASTPKPNDLDHANEQSNMSGGASGQSASGGLGGGMQQDPWEQEEEQQPPALVIYIVEPFTYNNLSSDVYRLSSLGLLRCYTQMLQALPEHIHNSIHLQVVTLDSILSHGRAEESSSRQDQLKALAFSVFSQCRRLLSHQSTIKSLTGFGPAAAQDLFMKTKDERNSGPFRIFSPPFILAPLKDKQTELGEMYGDRREKSSILYCAYCLSEDQRWLLASCTNEKGEILETCCTNIEIPNRTRRKKASARKFGLHKLLDFILGVLSDSVQPWRLVVGRLGRLGHGELRDWATLLSRKSLLRYSRQLKELCKQCAVLGPVGTPSILSACLVSLEPDSVLRIMPDQYTPDDRFGSSCHSCDLSTPEDASCTHILVFPTSATTQSSLATIHQEPMDPLGVSNIEDVFDMVDDGEIPGLDTDLNDIMNWTDSPAQSPSPHRGSSSQPGSPFGGAGGRQSPFQHGGPTRGGGGMALDSQEESLQLLQQPLALGYYVSTAKTGPLPKWFWSSCPHLEDACPVFLKLALLIHSPSVQQNSDDLLHTNPQIRNYHPLDSNLTTDVLRYVLEGYNALSWLSLNPATHDRRSCLPVHIQVLMQLYHAMEALM